MLFINPHLPFFGTGQVYEGHVHSDEGWNFTGYTRLGFPFPYVGHNEDVGWVSTDNAADLADVYAETFDDPARPLAYRYGNGHRLATERVEKIRVKTDAGFEERSFKMIKTHHGPVLGKRDGKLLAIRMAHFESDGWLREWYDMTRARTLAQFKRALRPQKMLFGNVMYADRAGNIFYLYNGAVPRRDPRFDWSKPVDGSDPATEWLGLHTMDELPQLTNPSTGWMQNCNTTPFLLTSEGSNPRAEDFPKYMVQEGDNPRGRISRRLLSTKPSWTFEEWTQAAVDTHVIMADELLPGWLAEVKQTLDAARGSGPTNRGPRAGSPRGVVAREGVSEPPGSSPSGRGWVRVRSLAGGPVSISSPFGRGWVRVRSLAGGPTLDYWDTNLSGRPMVREGITIHFVPPGTPKAFATFSPGLRAALPWEREIQFVDLAREAGDRDDRLRDAYDILNTWDHRATVDSIAMTIFNRWRDRVNRATRSR